MIATTAKLTATPDIRKSSAYLLENARDAGDLSCYFHPLSEAGNFGTRFQMAFQAYAIAAIGERTPAYRRPTADALATLIQRMFLPEIWAYWLIRGKSLDPVGPHNVMYSGHLGQMIGQYERFSCDGRFDRPFLLDDGRESRHEHTHATVAGALSNQMRNNECHGVTCEPGMIYASCNHHAAIATLLYDNVHHESLSESVPAWLSWMERRMAKPIGGVLNVAHITTYNKTLPISFRIMDAWGLAFLNPYGPELFRRYYPKFRRTILRDGDLARVRALPPNELLEIADGPLNTAFAYVAAKEAGDAEMSDALAEYARRKLDWTPGGSTKACWSAKRRMMVSALFALGEAIEASGMLEAMRPRPDGFFDLPELLSVEGGEVESAGWDAEGNLSVTIADVGGEVRVECARVEADRLKTKRGTVKAIQRNNENLVAHFENSGSVEFLWTRRGGLTTGEIDGAK
jgi:hypothetical protein